MVSGRLAKTARVLVGRSRTMAAFRTKIMRSLYVCELGFDDPPVEAFDEVVSRTVSWAGSWYGDADGSFYTPGRKEWVPQAGARVTWHADGNEAGTAYLWTFVLTRSDDGDPDLRWHTEVIVGRTPEECRASIRVARERVRGPLLPSDDRFPRPGLVNTLMGALRATSDGRRLRETPEVFDAARASELADLLCNPDRELPVVAISNPIGDDEPVADARRLGTLLAGLAHVVRLRDRESTYALSDKLGSNKLSVYDGGARLYWPGFSRTADMYAHPLFLRDRILEMQAAGENLADHLVAVLAGVRADRETLRVLRNRVREAIGSDRKRRRREAKQQAGGDWHAELERAWRQEEALEAELDDARARLAAAEARANETEEELRTLQAEIERSAEPPPQELTNVRQAVEQARAECPNLIILDEALDAADDSPYQQPDRILDALRKLDAIAFRYREGTLSRGFKTACEEVGLPYRSDVSPTARGMYGHEYRRSWNGQTIWLGPHIAFGAGTPRTCARIYFALDEDSRSIIVGHVGNHLRDTTTG